MWSPYFQPVSEEVQHLPLSLSLPPHSSHTAADMSEFQQIPVKHKNLSHALEIMIKGLIYNLYMPGPFR